ncbi:hypothetical protein CHUAL_008359 [Chamberlinius hualienensis]
MKSAPMTREPTVGMKFVSAGAAACIADVITFPLDTAKVRLQIQGEGTVAMKRSEFKYRGMIGTMLTMGRQEGVRSLYNGLIAGLQRQMCFASIRIGLYDNVKSFYTGLLVNGEANTAQMLIIRIMAGLTTGGAAVCFAQPTDVVKVRMQAQSLNGPKRYNGSFDAYRVISKQEGVRGLWKGVVPNVARNAVVNVAEIVCYDIIKDTILSYSLMSDNVPCHFVSAVAAGFCTTVIASPVDVVKTRFMNSREGQYKGAFDCAVRMFREGGVAAFYKGFIPNFSRFVSWNICMWISYEQLKRLMTAYSSSGRGHGVGVATA